jgi:ADP-heptose:LPS heptosyltransferase
MNLQVKLVLDRYVGGFLHMVLRIPAILLGKLLRRDHHLANCREIAILKLLGGGSLVIAYPALLALRRLPGLKKLTLITTPSIRPFGELLGIFDEIIVVRDSGGLLTLAIDSLQAFRKLFRYDALVDLEIHSRLTTVFSLLTAARNRLGFFTDISYWRRHLNTHLLFCNTSNGIYLFYDQLAAVFGTSPVAGSECEREFRSRLGEHTFENPGLVRVAIAPACSGLSRERMLRREEWVEIVAQRMARLAASSGVELHLVELHLLGAPSDREDLAGMAALLATRFTGRATVFNHAGETNLRESVRILAAMQEVLCIDSALLHFSRLLGRRTVSFWGPTDPRTLLRPNSSDIDEISYVKIPCSPCVHVSNQPPCRGHNICMRLAFDPAAALPRNQPWVLME